MQSSFHISRRTSTGSLLDFHKNLVDGKSVFFRNISGVADSLGRRDVYFIGTLSLVNARYQGSNRQIALDGVHFVQVGRQLVHMRVENRPRAEAAQGADNVLCDIQTLGEGGRGERFVKEQQALVGSRRKNFADPLRFLAQTAEVDGLVLVRGEVREDVVAFS